MMVLITFFVLACIGFVLTVSLAIWIVNFMMDQWD